jgi:hypothetical protein
MHFLCHLGKWITTERLNILLAVLAVLLAALTLLLAWVAYKLSRQTLSYMRDRDLELDTRNAWIEIHKAMVNLRTHAAIIRVGTVLVGYGPSEANTADAVTNFTLARSQLVGQLHRLNDDPLLLEISEFLLSNLLTKDWQTTAFEEKFDAFAKRVALKARPK